MSHAMREVHVGSPKQDCARVWLFGRPFLVVLLRGFCCMAKALARARELGKEVVLRLRENSAIRDDRLRLLVHSSLMLPRFMRLVRTSASRWILPRLS